MFFHFIRSITHLLLNLFLLIPPILQVLLLIGRTGEVLQEWQWSDDTEPMMLYSDEYKRAVSQ
ncbi:hypothetical protein ROSEINA2194_01619 [Roseburia inulinivorans DSM 16841]|uniref:Uncharacterized protein n=1 Tax=Roseburia inulinivorans DSM 16841 TaxID=622312 RepID=C0FSA3_9FIRM|nr:hypothetical protein ROSEINA2194_01619 [Roseburia inulinivorans DSM 16841]